MTESNLYPRGIIRDHERVSVSVACNTCRTEVGAPSVDSLGVKVTLPSILAARLDNIDLAHPVARSHEQNFGYDHQITILEHVLPRNGS